MKTVKVCFVDFWSNFNYENNFFINLIKKEYNVIIDNENPDFLFYSCFGKEFLKYNNCVKIFYTYENVTPNFNECDYAMGFDDIVFEDRYLHHKHPLEPSIQNRENLSDELANRKFCNFVFSNTTSGEGAVLRKKFCEKLMEYKHVDCPSKVLNNMPDFVLGKTWADKNAFCSQYKFTIAFENSKSNGYTTEKIFDAFQANSIPIYYGNAKVTDRVNEKAFVCCPDEASFDKVIEQIIYLDTHNDAYMEMLRQKPMNEDYTFTRNEETFAFIKNIFEKGNKPFNKDPRKWGTIHKIK